MIAIEKAGIFKKNSQIIIGERNNIIDKIFIEKAKEVMSPIAFVPKPKNQKRYSNVDYLNNNIRTAIYTCKALNLKNINNESISAGISNIIKNTDLFGRWTTVGNRPKVIFDAAHNIEGFRSISNQLQKTKFVKIHIILAFIKGKNIKEFINELPPDANLYFTSLNMDRGMSYNEIKKKLRGKIIYNENPKNLLETVKANASENDLILITGSNFLAKKIFK